MGTTVLIHLGSLNVFSKRCPGKTPELEEALGVLATSLKEISTNSFNKWAHLKMNHAFVSPKVSQLYFFYFGKFYSEPGFTQPTLSATLLQIFILLLTDAICEKNYSCFFNNLLLPTVEIEVYFDIFALFIVLFGKHFLGVELNFD